VGSAYFSFSSDLDVDGCELDDDDGSDETGFCWVDVKDWTLGGWKPDCLLTFQILRHEQHCIDLVECLRPNRLGKSF